MTELKIIHLKLQYINIDTDKLLLEIYRVCRFPTPSAALWGDQDYLKQLSELSVGDTMNFIFRPETTSKITASAPIKIPKLLFEPRTKLTKGSIVHCYRTNTIGKVVGISNAWIDIELFPSWAIGKPIKLITHVLEKRPATQAELDSHINYRINFSPLDNTALLDQLPF